MENIFTQLIIGKITFNTSIIIIIATTVFGIVVSLTNWFISSVFKQDKEKFEKFIAPKLRNKLAKNYKILKRFIWRIKNGYLLIKNEDLVPKDKLYSKEAKWILTNLNTGLIFQINGTEVSSRSDRNTYSIVFKEIELHKNEILK